MAGLLYPQPFSTVSPGWGKPLKRLEPATVSWIPAKAPVLLTVLSQEFRCVRPVKAKAAKGDCDECVLIVKNCCQFAKNEPHDSAFFKRIM
jgi:hypothetical protein